MVTSKVSLGHDARMVAALLDLPEITQLVADIDGLRWTGRPGYPVRAMVGLAPIKSVYALQTWTRTVLLVREHAALRDALGAAPSVDAAYRFTVKLRAHSAMLAGCLDRVLAGLHAAQPHQRLEVRRCHVCVLGPLSCGETPAGLEGP